MFMLTTWLSWLDCHSFVSKALLSMMAPQQMKQLLSPNQLQALILHKQQALLLYQVRQSQCSALATLWIFKKNRRQNICGLLYYFKWKISKINTPKRWKMFHIITYFYAFFFMGCKENVLTENVYEENDKLT